MSNCKFCPNQAMGWGEEADHCAYHSTLATNVRHRAGFVLEIGDRAKHHDVLENQGDRTIVAFFRQRLAFVTGRPYGYFTGLTIEEVLS